MIDRLYIHQIWWEMDEIRQTLTRQKLMTWFIEMRTVCYH